MTETTDSELNADITNAKKAVAQEVYDFLDRHLYTRPDYLNATMKFKDWMKLRKILLKYGVKP